VSSTKAGRPTGRARFRLLSRCSTVIRSTPTTTSFPCRKASTSAHRTSNSAGLRRTRRSAGSANTSRIRRETCLSEPGYDCQVGERANERRARLPCGERQGTLGRGPVSPAAFWSTCTSRLPTCATGCRVVHLLVLTPSRSVHDRGRQCDSVRNERLRNISRSFPKRALQRVKSVSERHIADK
jgi:hypothetical protein